MMTVYRDIFRSGRLVTAGVLLFLALIFFTAMRWRGTERQNIDDMAQQVHAPDKKAEEVKGINEQAQALHDEQVDDSIKDYDDDDSTLKEDDFIGVQSEEEKKEKLKENFSIEKAKVNLPEKGESESKSQDKEIKDKSEQEKKSDAKPESESNKKDSPSPEAKSEPEKKPESKSPKIENIDSKNTEVKKVQVIPPPEKKTENKEKTDENKNIQVPDVEKPDAQKKEEPKNNQVENSKPPSEGTQNTIVKPESAPEETNKKSEPPQSVKTENKNTEAEKPKTPATDTKSKQEPEKTAPAQTESQNDQEPSKSIPTDNKSNTPETAKSVSETSVADKSQETVPVSTVEQNKEVKPESVVPQAAQEEEPLDYDAEADINWHKMLNFFPYGAPECEDMDKAIGSKIHYNFPDSYKQMAEEHTNLFTSALQKEKTEGTEKHSGQLLSQTAVYLKLASLPFVYTVCETGFNAGHSALMWLAAKNTTKVYSFDIGAQKYAKPMADFLQTQFPGRLTVTWGDSTVTLPQFHRDHPDVICNLVVIDGGRTTLVAMQDFENLKKMTAVNNLVVLDDYPSRHQDFTQQLGAVWEVKKQMGEISEIFRCMSNDDRGFTIGRLLYD